MQNFLSLWLNAGAQITHGGQVQRPRQNHEKQAKSILFSGFLGGKCNDLILFLLISEPRNLVIFSNAQFTIHIRSNEMSNQIKSKLLVLGAVKTTINDHGCQHVTGRFESTRMFLSKQTAWPTFVQSHPSVKTEQWFKKKQLSHSLPTLRKGENKWPAQIQQNCPTGWNGYSDSESRAIVTHATAQPILWIRPLNTSLPTQWDSE